MERFRYGKMRLQDILKEVISILMGSFLPMIITVGVILSSRSEKSKLLVVVLGWFFLFLLPVYVTVFLGNRWRLERFSVEGEIITSMRGRSREVVLIPSDAIFVLSATAHSNEAGDDLRYIKDRNSLSILATNDLDYVIGKIQTGKSYLSAHVDRELHWHYLYSFVCDQELLDYLLQSGNHTVVMPAYLESDFLIDETHTKVYVDKNQLERPHPFNGLY